MQHANFVHLHLHSYYSLLDGAISLDKLAEVSKRYCLPAVAVTDHGNMFGAVEFYKKLSHEGIKPILGSELYFLTKGSRLEKSLNQGGGFLSHLTFLVKNHKGYQNLSKLISSSYLEGFYYKPRIDKEILQDHTEGLIVLSGCLKGELAKLLLEGRAEDAKEAAEYYAKLFGPERFYIELMDHGIDEQKIVNPRLIELAKEMGFGLVATNDCHYVEASDREAHEALLCIQTGKTLQEEKRMSFSSDKFYIRSPEEMASLFPEHPEAISNTVDIAKQCNFEFDFKTYHFPRFQPPDKMDLPAYLTQKVEEGFKKRVLLLRSRYGEEKWIEAEKEYRARIEEELAIIKKMGFAGYFLIVCDFIEHAKADGVAVGPGRGSAAGSLVAYSLGITDIDPIPYHLLFERFLNPERISMPDMDIDFCMRKRDRVIEYVSQKYGNVSQIITFGKMKARAVVRDVGRVMGLPYADVDKIAKMIPTTLGITLETALKVEPKLKDLAKKDPQVSKLLDIAMRLEGFPRHASTHAAGVVMSDQPLVNFLPLYKGQHDEVVTQFDMKAVESIGLIKFDFLGLRTLTLIEDAVRLVKENKGVEVDIESIPLDDKEVYADLVSGDTKGVFQLESSGMTDLIVRLKPNTFEDIIALVALFRPGPLGSGMVDDFIDRKHGRKEIKYELLELEEILKDTYGVIVYQEQVMQIASKLANFTLGDADLLRRAMGKKKAAEMALQSEKFIHGAIKNHIPPKKAERIFNLMAEFAGYGFNKCVIADTEIVDADSGKILTVGELVKKKLKLRAISCSDSLQMRRKKVVDAISNGKKKVFKLNTHLGHQIIVTANHPFLTIEGWKNLEELKEGDRIAVPRKLPAVGRKKVPEHQIISAAWLISEGNTCHPSSLYFFNNDKILINDFINNISKFPNTNTRQYKRRGCRIEVCVNTGKMATVPWNSKKYKECGRHVSGAYLWAEKVGILGKKAKEKDIPEFVFELSSKQLALFIGRIWSGDGFIFGKRNITPYYATSSYKMARQLQHLLLRLGIVSKITKKKFKYKNGDKIVYTVHVTGENSTQNFVDKVIPSIIGRNKAIKELKRYNGNKNTGVGCRDTIPWEIKWKVREEKTDSGKTWVEIEKETGLSMKEFYGAKHVKKKGFRRTTILKLGRYFKSSGLINAGMSDVYWDNISEIKSNGVKEVFDLTVETDHNFVANNIIVHNSHSAAYAMVAYRTAYLKTHYLTEFMAALLTTEMGNTDKVLEYMNDCKEHDIEILPPDVNESEINFTVVANKKIRFGLAAVKNVGAAALESIIESRKESGRYSSLGGFCERIDSRKVNKRVLESLIKCGAMDSFGNSRAELFAMLDSAMGYGAARQKEKEGGQVSMFEMISGGAKADHFISKNTEEFEEWSEHQILSFEKEALGFYLTGHPLAQYEALLKQYRTDTIKAITELESKREVRFAGVVSTMKEIMTKRGDKMAFVTAEDLTGVVETIIFSDVYKNAVDLLKGDQPQFYIGTSEPGEESVKVIVKEIFPLSELPDRLTKSVHFYLSAAETDQNQLSQLKSILGRYPGKCPAYVHISIPDKTETVLELPSSLSLNPSLDMVKTLEKVFGHNVTRFQS